jgi:hypothetical protein
MNFDHEEEGINKGEVGTKIPVTRCGDSVVIVVGVVDDVDDNAD